MIDIATVFFVFVFTCLLYVYIKDKWDESKKKPFK